MSFCNIHNSESISCVKQRNGLCISHIIKLTIGVDVDQEKINEYESSSNKMLSFEDPLNKKNRIIFRDFTKNTYILEYCNHTYEDYNDETFNKIFDSDDKKIINNRFNSLSKSVVISNKKITFVDLYNKLMNKSLTSLELELDTMQWQNNNSVFKYTKLPDDQYEINYSGNFNYSNRYLIYLIERYANN